MKPILHIICSFILTLCIEKPSATVSPSLIVFILTITSRYNPLNTTVHEFRITNQDTSYVMKKITEQPIQLSLAKTSNIILHENHRVTTYKM